MYWPPVVRIAGRSTFAHCRVHAGGVRPLQELISIWAAAGRYEDMDVFELVPGCWTRLDLAARYPSARLSFYCTPLYLQ